MGWALYCLSINTDVQKKLQEEVDQFPSLEVGDVQKLSFLKATVKETLRCYPPAPFVERRCTSNVTVGAHKYPKGTHFWCMIYAAHMDERNFPEPRKFNPERWLVEERKGGGGVHSRAYMPFSSGPQNCIGQKFALQEAHVLLWALARHFNFTLDDQDKVKMVIKAVASPGNLRIRVTKR
eukprot:TRINITY_DN64185_c0_g1_i1.p1 TRINITY_DN64185_c0_g1~~TRINITY_DN64185_c0_g1_i1.p1  ORF type:complete len:180 (+),score=20.99 TRINITY_DN64185_c0_g1_i1:239-778(+)